MSPQLLLDGVLLGATIGLGAIGLTLTYAILGFGNFSHGELLSWGAYLALPIAGLVSAVLVAEPLGVLSFGWPLVAATITAMALTGLLAFALDRMLFGRLGASGGAMTPVIASFGASLALRNLIQFLIGLAQAASGPLIGADYRSAVAFLVLLAVLIVKPTGLFGGRS